MKKMLKDKMELQRALYGNWLRLLYSQPAECAFCHTGNPEASRLEWHEPQCPRLEYLKEHYGVEGELIEERGLVRLYGMEFQKNGVYGWARNDREFHKLLRQAQGRKRS